MTPGLQEEAAALGLRPGLTAKLNEVSLLQNQALSASIAIDPLGVERATEHSGPGQGHASPRSGSDRIR